MKINPKRYLVAYKENHEVTQTKAGKLKDLQNSLSGTLSTNNSNLRRSGRISKTLARNSHASEGEEGET